MGPCVFDDGLSRALRGDGRPATLRAVVEAMVEAAEGVAAAALRAGGLERADEGGDEARMGLRLPLEADPTGDAEADRDLDRALVGVLTGLGRAHGHARSLVAMRSRVRRSAERSEDLPSSDDEFPQDRDGFEGEEAAPDEATEAPTSQPDDHDRAVAAAIRDLTAEAAHDQLGEMVGCEDMVGSLADVLCRRRKRNAILVGDPGVGKTAIAEALAVHLVSDEAPEELQGRPLIEVAMSDLVAGTRFRGDFEARMKALVKHAEAEGAILFIDEFHTVVGAGSSASQGGLDAGNILKPALARGSIAVIGATTPREMRELRRDGALMRRFQVLHVAEPSEERTRAILEGSVSAYERHHRVAIDADAIGTAVSLAGRHLPQRRFPDKAFDLVDAGASIAGRAGVERLGSEHLREAVALLGGPRLGRPDPDRALRVKGLEAALRDRVFGQDDAARDLARAARVGLMGLQPGGTSASYLFNGPTGVGKTEMAQAYAASLGLPLVVVPMSEFVEKHAVARLIGAPPGYVGYGDDGILPAAGDAHGEFVLLLDEIEKAHPDVFDILLQVLDKGVVHAGCGRAVSLVGAHVVMTANLGAAEAEAAPLGFGRKTCEREASRDALGRTFRREFLARIQSVIQFEHLGAPELARVADAELRRAALRLSDSGYRISFGEGLSEHLAAAAAGLDAGSSARALKALVKEEVVDPLVAAILDADGADGFEVVIEEDASTGIRRPAARPA